MLHCPNSEGGGNMAAVCRKMCDVNSSKFEVISQKFSSLAYGRSEGDRHIVNALLDDLNALDFSHTVVTNVDKAVLIINQCCTLVPPNDTFLVAKGCHLISNLVEKQNVHVEGPTLNVAVQWCIQALKQCPSVASQDVLAALEVLLKGNGTKVQEHSQTIVSALSPLLRGDVSQDASLSSPWEIRLAALHCLEALSTPPSDSPSTDSGHLQSCLKVFHSQLCSDKQPEQDEINFCKVLLSSLRGVENIVLQLSNSGSLVGDAVGIVKAFMLFGLPGHHGLKPSRVLPASVPISDLSPSTGRGQRNIKGVGSRTRSTRKKVTSNRKKTETGEEDGDETSALDASWFRTAMTVGETPWRTSDSDFSDTEGGQTARLRSQQARVRQAALQLLLTITKSTERRIMFGYWWSLLPDGPHAPNTRTLITCLLRDPSPRCRTAVLNVLWTMLTGSRAYLQQAEQGSDRSGSFIPFSVSLGNMLRELHRSLALALAAEGSVLALTQLLRVLAALVQNTPYHRMQPGLLTKTVRSVRSLTMQKDVNVQVAALTVLGAVVAVQPTVEELSSCLLRPRARLSLEGWGANKVVNHSVPSDDADIESDEEIELDAEEADALSLLTETEDQLANSDKTCTQSSVTSSLPWVLELCLTNLGTHQSPQAFKSGGLTAAPVRVESLQVLGALASCHFASAIAPNMTLVQSALETSLQDPDESIRLHSARATEMVVLAMQNTLKAEEGPKIPIENILSFWRELLRGPLTALVQNPDQAPLRAAACDCLANVGTGVFEKLPPEQQILSFTLLFGCAGDEESLVRASAIRALGLFTLFPCLRKDMQFILDAADAVIQALKDDSQVVRTKASWSLGNLSDALVLNRSEALEEVPDQVLFDLLQASVAASVDNDKVRSNGVRALGNLLRLISADALRIHSVEVVDRAVSALTRSASSGSNMKVRWNACYAIGNLLKNGALYEKNPKCQAAIFPVLNGLVQNFRNFKVRINAALALGVPDQRAFYGQHFVSVWAALLTGLDNSEHMTDFSEYKHRDALLDQICSSLCHVASLISVEDLSGIYDELQLHQDSLLHHLGRMQDCVVPEQSGVFLSAANHACILAANTTLNVTQHNAARLLYNIFSQNGHKNSVLKVVQ